MNPTPVITTNKARCRDCYRCVRVCPVKAIRMDDGQAQVVAERCVGCGTCIRECPQDAKTYRNDLDVARKLLAGDAPVGVSVAPSFAAMGPAWQHRRLPSALRRLGFAYVGETAGGAAHVAGGVADAVRAEPDRPHVCSACPAVVRLVETYHSDQTDLLTPLVSPMIAHGRMIRHQLGESARVVFIGPCVAKKLEAQRPELDGEIDCVLTFAELADWLAAEEIALDACEESGFDDPPDPAARTFALAGGNLRAAGIRPDLLATSHIAVCGPEEVTAALDALAGEPSGVLLEPLFCAQGCISGPAVGTEDNLFLRRKRVLDYSQAVALPSARPGGAPLPAPKLATRFAPCPPTDDEPITAARIREVLERTGKGDPADQLNCGACGYASCRDKAIAVLRGLAETEMCIPYMRRLAERRTDRIIETSPNGIVILDGRLRILSMNPAFAKLFHCSQAIVGKPVSYLMDPEMFERVAAGQVERFEGTVRLDRYHLTCHQVVYALADEGQYVGIFVDLTRGRASEAELDRVRAETVAQARELLAHQVEMAQHIAEFLGESSARGEQLVDNLLQLTRSDNADNRAGSDRPDNTPRGRDWLRRTYMSK
jgi:iron only hydrogenase large subunit-like protein/uncharacterized Fe-S cluster-containing protein